MNTSTSGVKKPALCRYFVASGTCFYGNDCQFLHANFNSSSPVLSEGIGGGGAGLITGLDLTGSMPAETILDSLENIGGLSRLDQYLPYSHQNGLLSESKLSSYIRGPSKSTTSNTTGRSEKSPVIPHSTGFADKLNAFPQSSNATATPLADNLSMLTLDSSPAPTSNEFIPKSTIVTQGGRSTSTGGTSQTSANSPFLGYDSSAMLENVHFSTRGSQGLKSVSATSSPLHSPRLSPQHSPSSKRRNHSPIPFSTADNFIPGSVPTFQKNVDGTTYFYPADNNAPQSTENPGVGLPNYIMFPFTPAHIRHMKPKANAPSFFMPDELRLEILQRHSLTMAQVDPAQYPDLPVEVDNYHNLFPLEPLPNSTLGKSSTFGYVTSTYRATNIKTGLTYCLRRIHGFRLVYPKVLTLIDMWKKLQHSNVVQLREVFTTKAFGEHSTVFVHDYHPGAETLMAKHFSHLPHVNGLTPSLFCSESSSRSYSQSSGSEPRQHAGLLPESLIWSYVVQLCSAMRTVHAAGLACRMLDPSKILITGKSRIRFNCCGIYDVLAFDPNQANALALMSHYQQEDLVTLGKVVLALACNSLERIQRDHLPASMELVARNYSSDLRNLILYLLTNQNRVRSVNDIMPMIGARFFTQLDASHLRSDVLENELAKEVECGRLFRLMTKLNTINERAELNLDASWSETGDRYMLKLFRDYVFHQVTEDGRPWIDMAHVIQCLNKLDAGAPEKVCLMSRDEQNILVVTYAELKHCFEASFNEVLQAATEPKVT